MRLINWSLSSVRWDSGSLNIKMDIFYELLQNVFIITKLVIIAKIPLIDQWHGTRSFGFTHSRNSSRPHYLWEVELPTNEYVQNPDHSLNSQKSARATNLVWVSDIMAWI